MTEQEALEWMESTGRPFRITRYSYVEKSQIELRYVIEFLDGLRPPFSAVDDTLAAAVAKLRSTP